MSSITNAQIAASLAAIAARLDSVEARLQTPVAPKAAKAAAQPASPAPVAEVAPTITGRAIDGLASTDELAKLTAYGRARLACYLAFFEGGSKADVKQFGRDYGLFTLADCQAFAKKHGIAL